MSSIASGCTAPKILSGFTLLSVCKAFVTFSCCAQSGGSKFFFLSSSSESEYSESISGNSMLSEVAGGGSNLARARAAISFLTIWEGWSSSSCMALPLPLLLGLGVPFLRGVAATTLDLVVSDGATAGTGFGSGTGAVSFEEAGVLRMDLGWVCC